MTQVDFYILQPGARHNRQGLGCRLAEKAWLQGHRVLIHTDSEQESQQLDRLLWTFRQDSFIPHGLLHQADPAMTPVLIGHQDDPAGEHEVLINLSQRIPPFFSRFQRLAETLDQTPELLAAGRARYRHYQQRGYELRHHEIK